jgi:osmotically-inducible protein OsmY
MVAPPNSLLGMVQRRLQDSGYLALRDVDCSADDQNVVLRGNVPSFYLKQLAQEVVRAAVGVRHIVNEIEVNGQKQK